MKIKIFFYLLLLLFNNNSYFFQTHDNKKCMKPNKILGERN